MTQQQHTQVFEARNRFRARGVKWTVRFIVSLFVFLLSVLVIALVNGSKPDLPNLNEKASAYRSKLDPSDKLTFSTPLNKKYKGFKDFLYKKLREDSLQDKKQLAGTRIRAAFYTPWTSGALHDLQLHGNSLTTIYPEWFFIDTISHRLQTRIDSAGLALMRQYHLSIQPILTNFHSGDPGYFDKKPVQAIINDPAKRQGIITQIIDTLSHYGLQGINIDFEEIGGTGNEPLVNFQKQFYNALHARGFTVSMDVQAMNEDYDIRQLAAYNDHIMLMAYDQYSDATGPGPISGQKWIEQQLDWLDDRVVTSKIILGLAGYGRDWVKENDDQHVEDISFFDAIAKAKVANAAIRFDNDSYNLNYSYTMPGDEADDSSSHQVWFTDAATLFNIMRFADDYSTAGTALWHLGGEDPRIWNFYGRDLSSGALKKEPFDLNSFNHIPYDLNSKPASTGEGELLDLLYPPSEGRARIEADTAEMLVSEQQYLQLPSGYVYRRFAEDKTPMGPGHKIILTFDDGPDPVYTPRILDILEKEKVPATFFLVGLNAEQNIPLVQRIYRDGYEIGNHTFTHGNIAKMSAERAALEMKTTRLLIECVTGHSTILFRAPYNADSEPQNFEEIEPIARSKKDNYITVGESIDPNDWDPGMTADSIVHRTIRFAEANNASIILLHDAGGLTRQPTVDALPRIISYFKKRGCTFTTVAGLMGKSRDEVMPRVKKSWINSLNFFIAEATYWSGHILFALFITGIVLSVGRILFMAILALVSKKREKAIPDNPAKPPVSIIVPAYNEELNAVRTVQSLLRQDYPQLRILFIDDGSSDNTYKTVSEAFAGDPRVEVHTKPNGGKASALNYGIEISDTEYLVCIDADTQLKENAVSELMKKFDGQNGKVAAVAGNVKVGNEVNMITRWQSIEYITAQNFDRRAFDLLNGITVVPGALGAFRKDALEAAGGFTTDTLAEDCDLTMRLHKNHYIIRNGNTALSYTEAPETIKQFLKQRFRWSFGVMQCFWKHRDALFNPRYKNFGMVAMPNILIFQMILPILAPLADLILVLSLIAAGFGLIPASIGHILFYYLVFTLVDIAGAALAFVFEKEKPGKLLWMIPQRLIYRQLMYYILFRSFSKAIKGETQGWGVLKRTGNVKPSNL